MPFNHYSNNAGDEFSYEVEDCAGHVSARHTAYERSRQEGQVLWPLEQIRIYCSFLSILYESGAEGIAVELDRHPLGAISGLLSFSYDEEMRQVMCQLGALQTLASLFHLDHAVHGPKPKDQCCNSLRRYALMALSNLIFDGNNKALLCANKEFMEALVALLDSAPDDLLQVTGSVLRDLSWQADNNMNADLNEIGTVTALVKAAMKNKNENTLKSILSALWSLSTHCSTSKTEFCAVEGALAFLVDMLTYEGPSKTLTIIEIAGGILCNVSTRIAIREDYREILRQRNCLGILLQQLKSESLAVVSYACGTLWVLSAGFPEDQKYLWDNGAVPMLRSLIYSKHELIAEGSSGALENLLNFRPPIAKPRRLKGLPTLNARKQRTLEHELNRNQAETYDNLDAITPSKEKDFPITMEADSHVNSTRLTQSAIDSKSTSRDSIVKAKPDSNYEKYRRGHSWTYNIEGVANIQPPTEPASHIKAQRKNDSRNLTTYQETDLDQPTNFSLRYAENQAETDSDEKESNNRASNEIIQILEDTVKCCQTEGTPYAISNAASVSDLRNPKPEEQPPVAPASKRAPQKPETATVNAYGCGAYTPEKPINYCEEATPGYFSRYESLSNLDESPQNFTTLVTKTKPEVVEEETFPEGSNGKSRHSPNPGIQLHPSAQRLAAQQRLLSVFEVDVNTSRVEDTPAQFLCATSPNEPDEPKIEPDSVAKELVLDLEAECLVNADEVQREKINDGNGALTDVKKEGEDTMLLTTYINKGMNRGASPSELSQSNIIGSISTPRTEGIKTTDNEDTIRQYFTKDAPYIKKRRKKKFSLRLDRPDNYNDRTNARLLSCA